MNPEFGICISLWQPWATALLITSPVELKPDETRHWPAPRRLIGKRIGIHAAKRDTRDEREFWDELSEADRAVFAAVGIGEYADLPRGCVIGSGILAGCVRTEESGVEMGSPNYSWGNFAPERFAWRFVDKRFLPLPMPCVGRQGFFNPHSGGSS